MTLVFLPVRDVQPAAARPRVRDGRARAGRPLHHTRGVAEERRRETGEQSFFGE